MMPQCVSNFMSLEVHRSSTVSKQKCDSQYLDIRVLFAKAMWRFIGHIRPVLQACDDLLLASQGDCIPRGLLKFPWYGVESTTHESRNFSEKYVHKSGKPRK